MAVNRISLRIQSSFMTGADITDLLGQVPSRIVESGAPISLRNPQGPKHQVTTWLLELEPPELDPPPPALPPVLKTLAESGQLNYRADLVVMASAAPLGSTFALTSELIGLLADAHCGLLVDAYPLDE